MSAGRYKQAHEGEWEQPNMKSYRMMCCDCGLVHRFEFRIVGRKIQMRAWRDNERTARARKYQKISLSRGPKCA